MILLLRLLAAAMGAVALTAQNPLAVAADPFTGAFQNEQLKLELAGAAGEYSGMILLGGQSLPVKAKAVAGKLTGIFDSRGQTYTFQATRDGSQLSLTTEGVTHVLQRAAPTAPAIGEWQSQSGIVRVNADGSATIGDKSYRWTIEGNVITFAGSGGESIRVAFEMAGNTWTWKFPEGQLVLTRMAAGAAPSAKGIAGSWQGPSGKVQINLDGTATVAGVNYRYTLAGNQLTLAGPDGNFAVTIEQSGDAMNWVVNGKKLTFQRVANLWAVGGGPGILPDLVGRWCSSSSACYTLLADGSYQFASGPAPDSRDSGTWTATDSALTSTSKKFGARTMRLERRNHPKTVEPMLVLDEAEYVTAYPKPPWR